MQLVEQFSNLSISEPDKAIRREPEETIRQITGLSYRTVELILFYSKDPNERLNESNRLTWYNQFYLCQTYTKIVGLIQQMQFGFETISPQ